MGIVIRSVGAKGRAVWVFARGATLRLALWQWGKGVSVFGSRFAGGFNLRKYIPDEDGCARADPASSRKLARSVANCIFDLQSGLFN